MVSDYGTHDGEDKIAWDLRQAWAKQVEFWEGKITTRDIPLRNYGEWLRDIEMLYDLVFPRVKKNKIERVNAYKAKLNFAYQKANEHISVFNKKSYDAKGTHELENAIRSVHRYIRKIIEQEGMYGGREEERGL